MITSVLQWHVHTNCQAVALQVCRRCCVHFHHFHSEMVRFQMQCIAVCARSVRYAISWFYWKWKIAMIMNTHLLRQFNNNNIDSLLFCSRSICLIQPLSYQCYRLLSYTFWCDIEIFVIMAFAHAHTLLMAIHSWLFLFSFVVLYLVFKVKFEFKFIWLHRVCVCVSWQFHIQWLDLACFVFSSALINSNAVDVTIPPRLSISVKWSERREGENERKNTHVISRRFTYYKFAGE